MRVRYCLLRNIACFCAFLWAVLAGGHLGHADSPPRGVADQEVRIAVLAFRGEEETLRQWQPTANYLSSRIPGYAFRIVPLSLSAMAAAVGEARVDFVFTNPGNYVEHEARYGVTRIATYKPSRDKSGSNKFGAVIFTRNADNGIHEMRDLKGKRFMAVNEHAFGGFQLAWYEMKAQGIDPFADLAQLTFVGFPHDRIIDAVLSGEADAGICRTGVLENLAQQGRIDLADVRVINARQVPGFPDLLSTRLYPEWPFARLNHTSDDLAQKVVIALLSMPEDDPAAVEGGYAGWTVPLDYQPVHDLFKELRVSPYDAPVEITLSDLLRQYWQWGVFAGVLAAIGVLWGIRVEHLVTRRTAELSRANTELETQIAERKRAEETARLRQNELAHISRVSTMGELTASLAHEINQPLSAISNYAQGSVRRLDQGRTAPEDLGDVLKRIAAEAERAGEVIRRVRTLVRKGEVSPEPFDLNAIVRDVVSIVQAEAARQNVRVVKELDVTVPPVVADKIQIEQVLLNLVGNAFEALHEETGMPRAIYIATRTGGGGEAECSVSDTGCGVPAGQEDKLFEPFYSTKPDGMGMGLSISRSIIEASGGRLWGKTRAEGGAIFTFALPLARGTEEGGEPAHVGRR